MTYLLTNNSDVYILKSMQIVNIRDLARTPKKVVEDVKKTKQPRQIVSQKKPQAVIISLEDYDKLKVLNDQEKQQQSIQILLDLAKLADKQPKTGKKTNALKMIDQMWQDSADE